MQMWDVGCPLDCSSKCSTNTHQKSVKTSQQSYGSVHRRQSAATDHGPSDHLDVFHKHILSPHLFNRLSLDRSSLNCGSCGRSRIGVTASGAEYVYGTTVAVLFVALTTVERVCACQVRTKKTE